MVDDMENPTAKFCYGGLEVEVMSDRGVKIWRPCTSQVIILTAEDYDRLKNFVEFVYSRCY